MKDFEIVKRNYWVSILWNAGHFLKEPLGSADCKRCVPLSLTKLFYSSVEIEINLQKMDNNTKCFLPIKMQMIPVHSNANEFCVIENVSINQIFL